MSKDNKPFYKRGVFYLFIFTCITFTAHCIVKGFLEGWESVFYYVLNTAYGFVFYSLIRDVFGSISENLLKERVKLQEEVIELYEKAYQEIQKDTYKQRKIAEKYYMGFIPLFRDLHDAVIEEQPETEEQQEIVNLVKIVDHQASYIAALELESNELRKRLEDNKKTIIEGKKQCLI